MKATYESIYRVSILVLSPCMDVLFTKDELKGLIFIHERSLRIVYDDYDTTFEDLLKKDNSVSIHHRNVQKVSIEMFKVKHNLCPEFIPKHFSPKKFHNTIESNFS